MSSMQKKKKQVKVQIKIKPKKNKNAGRPGSIRGRGAYSLGDVAKGALNAATYSNDKTNVGKAARFLGQSAGNMLHPAVGKLLGNAASWFTSLFGGGRYHIKSNSLLNAAYHAHASTGSATVPGSASGFVTNSPPSFSSINNGSEVTLSHREFVADIPSSIGFSLNTYLINPGNPLLFPWLSQMASMYEEYEFLGLIFEFKSTSATAVGTTSSAMGAVVMATDYDCLDSPFTTKRAMETAEFATDSVPYESIVHPVECAPSSSVMRSRYINPQVTTIANTPGDARFSVLGNFNLATQGQQVAGTTIGELWVSYHVKLRKPILELALNQPTPYSLHNHGLINSGGLIINNGTISSGSSSFNITVTGSSTTCAVNVFCNSALYTGTYLAVLRCCQATGVTWATPSVTAPTLIAGASSVLYATNNVTGVSDGSPCIGQQANNVFTYTPVPSAFSYAIFTVNNIGDGISMPVVYQGVNVTYYDLYLTSYNLAIATPHKRKIDPNLERIERLERLITSQPNYQPTPNSSVSSYDDCEVPLTEEEKDRNTSSSSSMRRSSPPARKQPLAETGDAEESSDINFTTSDGTKWVHYGVPRESKSSSRK
jgi:hypothetical protein